MPPTAKTKAVSRNQTTKGQNENEDKENNKEKKTLKKKNQDEQMMSNKKRTKQQQRSPSPELVKSKKETSENDKKLSRSRSAADLSPNKILKDSNTTISSSKNLKKTENSSTVDGKSKRRESPSPPNKTTNDNENRKTNGVPRVTTTPVTAKNIRHRSVSSSSITTNENKKSVIPTSKRKTVKTLDAQPSRSKSSMARSTRRTIRRQTTYLSIPSIINGNIKSGQILAVGENGMTQLGLKSAIDQRKNPQPVLIPEPVIQIAAGPLHSVCLTNKNNIYTFGCNDEHALGRPDKTDEDEDEDGDTDPFGEVDLTKIINIDQEFIVQIVAGDSHTLILSNIGKVYGWGTFRSSTNGIYGLVRKRKFAKKPVEICLPEKIVKLASGNDFVLFLSETGKVYSCGNGETGQLGRLSRYASEDGRRGGIERLITPALILYNRSSVKEKNLFFEDIFTGAHHYFLKVQGQSYILGGGLNNFHQLGLTLAEPVFFPTHISSLDGYQWKKFAGGLHHTLGLTMNGEVYAMGRFHEGQLGIENLTTHVSQPTLIENVPKAIDIACGNHVSFIIDEMGKVYSFGAGTSLQHGHGEIDIKVPRIMSSKFMDMKKIVNIAVGAQHTIFLTKE